MAQNTYDTPGQYTFTAEVDETVRFEVWGAGGAQGGDSVDGKVGGSGGSGGYIDAEFSMNDGESVDIWVGGTGTAGSDFGAATGGAADPDGWDSGGDGGDGNPDESGGGGSGGSASAVTSSGVELIVGEAGGGGGGAGSDLSEGGGGGGGAGGGLGGSGFNSGGDATGSGSGGDGGDGGTSGSGGFPGSSGSDGGTFSDAGVTVNSSSVGGGSAGSNDGQVVVHYTEEPNPPSAPSSLSASAQSDSQIDLSWTDNSTNEDGFYVYRSTSSGSTTGDYTQVADLGVNTTSYSDTGLSGSTTYYYRVSAYNAGGESSLSNEDNATTDATPSPPALTTDAVSNISDTSATFNGTIDNTNGDDVDERGFVWDTTSQGDPGSSAPGSSGYANNWTETGTFSTGSYSRNETTLSADTTYYVRAVAQNSAGWNYGNEVSFTTDPSATPPSLTTDAETNVTDTDATFNGTIDNTNGDDVDERGFVWDTTSQGDPGSSAPGSSGYANNWTESGTFSAGSYSRTETTLSPNTTYYVRAVAQNVAGWNYGAEISFTTDLYNITAGGDQITNISIDGTDVTEVTIDGTVVFKK